MSRATIAEGLGTAFLLAAVVGSGIMGERLAGGNVAIYFARSGLDLYLARTLCVVLTLLALENLFTLILEIYRPRLRGQAARVLYESRLVGLLGQPESLFTTAAHALDYQFGFKVSDTWFFQFVQKAFAWLVLIQVGLLWLSTCFVFIEPEEQALLERCGQPVAGILEAGPHLKLPWPLDTVYRYQTHRVQTFTIGVVPKEGEVEENTIVWTKSHYKEEFNLPVANKETPALAATADKKTAPPANLVTASVPVQYRIKDIVAWARKHANPDELLERLATREVVRHLVSVDFFEFMSVGRKSAAEALRANIQKAADKDELGVEIFVRSRNRISGVTPHGRRIIGMAQAMLNEAEGGVTYRLGGPSCLAGDIIGDYGFATAPTAGTRIAFLDQAHYSMVKTNTFNGVPLPAIALWNSDTDALKLVREFYWSEFRDRLS